MKIRLALIVVLAWWSCQAITSPWGTAGAALLQTQENAATPGPRRGHSLVYDQRLRRVVLVAATPATPPPAPRQVRAQELWSWDGSRWERLHTSVAAPAAHTTNGAVFDSRRKRLVMYGGRIGGMTQDEVAGDTWEWDGQRWQQMPDTSVGARDHHMLAYDTARGRTVLFGGTVFPRRAGAWATDTWEWDGKQWTQAATDGPRGRIGALAYDSRRKQVVLFGGHGDRGDPTQPIPYFQDTWVWNGKSWRKVSEGGPAARSAHSLSFDDRAGVLFLYGGFGRAGTCADMWQWDGTHWKEIKTIGPGKRFMHAMAYDAARGKTVLYGGSDGQKTLDDTWEWDGKQWAQVK